MIVRQPGVRGYTNLWLDETESHKMYKIDQELGMRWD